jgi:hypothetical protein
MATPRARVSVGERELAGHHVDIERRTRAETAGPERRRVMSAQTPYLEVNAVGVFPALLLAMVLILTALGILAHVAFA